MGPPKGPLTKKMSNTKPPPPPPPPQPGTSTPKLPPHPPLHQGKSISTKPHAPGKAPPPPSKLVQHMKRTSVTQGAPQSSNSTDLQTPNVKPNVNLLPGWIC